MANCYCVYCGQKSSSVANLTAGWCSKHPDGVNRGKHVLYEGAEKSQYVCKYCGRTNSTIANLVSGWCSRHPDGVNKGKHSPAL